MRFLFDIDDTILFSEVKPDGSYVYRDADFCLIEKLNTLYDDGNEIILWTGRHWNHLNVTQQQLSAAGVKYHTLIMGKPVADVYIDDRSLRPDEFLKMRRRTNVQ